MNEIPPPPEQILADVTAILRNFNGREFAGPITRSTRFITDLGLGSIDALTFSEQLEKHYGREFPFHLLVQRKDGESVADINVGELVDFLRQTWNEPAENPSR